jgi:glycosyltransferase involved in cell wall biosynthesis
MAAGTPVVSTTLGAEGLAVTNGKDILIADAPETMADAVVRMQSDSPERRELIANARQLVQTRYDWNVVGEILLRLHAEQVEMGAACLEAK